MSAAADPAGVLAALLAEQAPELADRPLVVVPGGQDNAVVRIGGELVARLPRHPDAARLQANEQRWLPVVAADLPLAVPDAVLLGRPSPRFPWPWTVVRWIDGGTADVTAYDDAAVAGQLVGLLRALHRPAPADAPANAWRGVPLSAREHRHAEALSELGHPRADALRRELHVLARVPGPRVPRTWVHGDLHPRNLVVRDRRLVGLIDWGDVHGGDPAVDLASVWMLLPVALHDVVRERLAVDDDTWQRARGWALVLGVLLLRVAAAEGDAAFAVVGERTLERACP